MAASEPKQGAIGFKSIVGKWVSDFPNGKVEFPENKKLPMNYGEEIEIIQDNRPFLTYSSTTWTMKKDADKQLMHSESGFIRFPSAKGVQMVISQCTGITEITSGDIIIENDQEKKDKDNNDDVAKKRSFSIELLSNNIGGAQKITQIKRIYKYDCSQDILSYEIQMSTKKISKLTKHLSATFKRKN